MTIIAVSTAQELMEALESASGGDRIELAAGDYGDLSISKLEFDERVTITSADPDSMASFSTVYLNYVENITLEHVFVDFQPTEDTLSHHSALKVGNSAHIKIDNVVLEGDHVAREAENGDIEFQPLGRAASIFNSTDVTFSNNDASVFRSGLNLLSVEDVTVSDNHIHQMRSSGTGGSDIQNLVLTGNHFSDFSPFGNPSTNGDHSGFVHYWTKVGQETKNTNFYIADNFFEVGGNGDQDNHDSRTSGINLQDQALQEQGFGVGFENILIENNVLHHAATMGIAVQNGTGVVIRDNTLVQSGGEYRKAPGIMVMGDVVENWTIEGNILTEVEGVAIRGMQLASDDLTLADLDVTMSDNLLVQRVNPEADNYIGKLFVNGLTQNGDLDDFRVLPGTDAANVGARQLRPEGDSLVVISAETNTGLETLSVSVSVEDLLGGLSEAQMAGMSVTWDFGDGTTGTGNDLVHTYAQTGTYEITGTATAPNSAPVELTKTVEVITPNGIDIRFDTGIVDISDTENTATVTGNIGLLNVASGKVLDIRDKDARVKFEVNEELSNNPNFTLSFDFKYDDDSQSGFAVYFPGTAVIRLNDGELRLTGKTSLNEAISIRSDNMKLDDSNWHRVSYVLSQATGTASLYIDGTLVGNIFGLQGIQPPSQSHGLTLGSPFGTSFTGQLDNVSFLRAALTEEDIDLLHGSAEVSLNDLEGIQDPNMPEPEPVPEVIQTSVNTPPVVDVQEPVTFISQDPVDTPPVSEDTAVQPSTPAAQPTSQVPQPTETDPIEPTIVLAPINQNIDTAAIARLNPGIAQDVLQSIALQFSTFTTTDEDQGSGGWLEWASLDETTGVATPQPVDAVGIHLFGDEVDSTASPTETTSADADTFLSPAEAFDLFG